ncbi:MAG: hypothetical protein JKY49_07295 [Cohaesibacteraceae bacterium]|nr:hypothetical protein [Cohaesibacteraceae bacterium]MBL4874988.1 hypothetical protein [Cohaesibacteraceae bacterium]
MKTNAIARPLIVHSAADDTGVSDEGTGEGDQSASFSDGLTGDGHGAYATEQGWNNADDVIKAHQDLSASSKELVRIPGKDASDDDKAAFRKALGVPVKAEDYSFKLPEQLPEGLAYDASQADTLKGVALDLGLDPNQADGIHQAFVSHMVGLHKASEDHAEQQATATTDALEKAWGETGTEGFKRNLSLLDRVINKNGGDGLRKELIAMGAVHSNGGLKSPQLSILLAKIGAEYFDEDMPQGGGAGTQTPANEDHAEILYPANSK